MASAKPPNTTLSPDDLKNLLAALRTVDLKLSAIRTPDLQGDDLGKWYQLSGNVNDAVENLERRTLASLNQAFGQDAAAIVQAIGGCEKALRGLNDRANVLKIVGAVASTIGTIATLA